MNLQGLFWIEKVKIENTDRKCKGGNNFEKLNRSYIQECHKEISKQQEQSMMGQLRKIPT